MVRCRCPESVHRALPAPPAALHAHKHHRRRVRVRVRVRVRHPRHAPRAVNTVLREHGVVEVRWSCGGNIAVRGGEL